MAPIDGPDYSTSRGAEQGLTSAAQRMKLDADQVKQLAEARDDLLAEIGIALEYLLINNGFIGQSQDMGRATYRFREILSRTRMMGL